MAAAELPRPSQFLSVAEAEGRGDVGTVFPTLEQTGAERALRLSALFLLLAAGLSVEQEWPPDDTATTNEAEPAELGSSAWFSGCN